MKKIFIKKSFALLGGVMMLGAGIFLWSGQASAATVDCTGSEAVTKIGDTCYQSLLDAVSAVPNDGEETTIQLLIDTEEGGLGLFNKSGDINKNFIVDLNGKTYTIGNQLVGSSGTVSQSIHLEKGNTVKFMNGTITTTSDSESQMLIQNYSNLTLDNVIVDGTKASKIGYVISNNFGKLNVHGDSQIIAKEGAVAFDLWYGLSESYDEGITVNFADDFIGTVNGTIEYGVAGRKKDEQDRESKVSLSINGTGVFDGAIKASSDNDLQKANIKISGGTFSQLVLQEHLEEGLNPVQNAEGKYEVIEIADLEWADASYTGQEKRTLTEAGNPFWAVPNDDLKVTDFLAFVPKINTPYLAKGGNVVAYKIEHEGNLIAYGASPADTINEGSYSPFLWSFRDLRSSESFNKDGFDSDNFIDGFSGKNLVDVEKINNTILPAGTVVNITVIVKLNDNSTTSIEKEYTITAQDVINATNGEKATLTFNTNGGSELASQTVLSGTAAVKPADPTRPGYVFGGWFADDKLTKPFDFEKTPITQDTTIYAKWTKKSTGGGSSGGGSSLISTPTTNTGAVNTGAVNTGALNTETVITGNITTGDLVPLMEHKDLQNLLKEYVEANKADAAKTEALGKALASIANSDYSQELKDAYLYAYLNGITTMGTIEDADLDRELTRAEMAKMMSVYATKLFKRTAVKTETPVYGDLDNVSEELKGYITLAYQLQIMGIHADGSALTDFDPHALVTRGEFATVLSRVLFGSTYNVESVNFSEKHLEALKSINILKDTNPLAQELRGWVMLMLMRAGSLK